MTGFDTVGEGGAQCVAMYFFFFFGGFCGQTNRSVKKKEYGVRICSIFSFLPLTNLDKMLPEKRRIVQETGN